MSLDCRYCGQPARLVNGANIYPHRPDLAALKFWRCTPCDAWVGVHEGTETPLGILAKAELRKLKTKVYAMFDPLWKTNPMMSRSKAYRWLAQNLGIPKDECHIGMFNEERCNAALELLTQSHVEVKSNV